MCVSCFRYNDILLKRLFLNRGAVYSPARLSLVTLSKGGGGYPRVEEFTDIVGMNVLNNDKIMIYFLFTKRDRRGNPP